MKKMNLFTVVMSSLLMTFGLATSAMAGAIIDTDGDLIPDAFDNCTEVANGQAPGGTCSNQIDDNGDGYGNICDADLDNDGIVAFADFQILVGAIGDPPGPKGFLP